MAAEEAIKGRLKENLWIDRRLFGAQARCVSLFLTALYTLWPNLRERQSKTEEKKCQCQTNRFENQDYGTLSVQKKTVWGNTATPTFTEAAYLLVMFTQEQSVSRLRCWKSPFFFSGIHSGTAGMVIRHLVTAEVDRYSLHYALLPVMRLPLPDTNATQWTTPLDVTKWLCQSKILLR